MSKLGSKGGKGLGKEGANRHGKVLQCGCIKEETMPVISGLAHQDGTGCIILKWTKLMALRGRRINNFV